MADVTSKVIQIIPADGWVAKYKDGTGKETTAPVACWALFEITDENGKDNWVKGLVPSDGVDYLDDATEGLEEDEEFVGYFMEEE